LLRSWVALIACLAVAGVVLGRDDPRPAVQVPAPVELSGGQSAAGRDHVARRADPGERRARRGRQHGVPADRRESARRTRRDPRRVPIRATVKEAPEREKSRAVAGPRGERQGAAERPGPGAAPHSGAGDGQPRRTVRREPRSDPPAIPVPGVVERPGDEADAPAPPVLASDPGAPAGDEDDEAVDEIADEAAGSEPADRAGDD
jgi:hypothetical protein